MLEKIEIFTKYRSGKECLIRAALSEIWREHDTAISWTLSGRQMTLVFFFPRKGVYSW